MQIFTKYLIAIAEFKKLINCHNRISKFVKAPLQILKNNQITTAVYEREKKSKFKKMLISKKGKDSVLLSDDIC